MHNGIASKEYPFPELLPLLKIEHTTEAYQAIVAQRSMHTDKREATENVYRNFLPDYRYAICPLCGTFCHEPVDTYALPLNTLKFPAYGPFYADYPDSYDVPCPHYIGTHTFLHLHEQTPYELKPTFGVGFGEVPYVTPWVLVDSPLSFAVLHALPICRIEDKKFVPRYTRYILTYFSEAPRRLIDQVYARQRLNHPIFVEHPYIKGLLNPPPPSRNMDFIPKKYRQAYIERYDLQKWTGQGKLGWLDFTSDDLELRIGQDLRLPDIYQDILGRRYRFLWDGKSLQGF